MMEKRETKASYIYVQFSDGGQYRIPAKFVAEHRARYYAKFDSERHGLDYQTVLDEEIEIALTDNYELLDWAANNMDWVDVCHVAKFVKDAMPPANKSREWVNAHRWIQGRELDD